MAMPLSRKTLAVLSGAIASMSHAEISELAFEVSLTAGGYTRRDRAIALLQSVEATHEAEESQAVYSNILHGYLQRRGDYLDEDSDLALALRLDGYEWKDGRLLPAQPGPAALSREVSILEQRLSDLGFEVALNHYQQAVDAFVGNAFEASNGQVRSFLEGLLISHAARATSKQQRTNPKAALQDLRDAAIVDNSEWNFFRYFCTGPDLMDKWAT